MHECASGRVVIGVRASLLPVDLLEVERGVKCRRRRRRCSRRCSVCLSGAETSLQEFISNLQATKTRRLKRIIPVCSALAHPPDAF